MSSKSSPLSEISGFSELVNCYEKNKHKPWNEWLEYEKSYKSGKQGLVGTMRVKENNKVICWKVSQYVNSLCEHESTVMRGLNELSSYCPHFCKWIGNIKAMTDPKNRKSGNPFSYNCKYPVEKTVMLFEQIEGNKFYNHIRSETISEISLYSTVKQVLMATAIAQKDKQFAHYDLHSENIIMKKCKKEVVFLYVLDDDSNQFAVPTYGYYPVIIDFGFSYINNLEDGPLWPSLAHTDAGFMSDRFDWVGDPKLFLVTVSGEIKEKRKTKKAKKLRRIVRNIFSPLSIEWDSGWDDTNSYGAADDISTLIRDYNKCSSLFEDYDHYCIDIIQTLIIMPLEEQSYKNIGNTFKSFLKEWIKIENEISDPFFNMYILQGVVEAARHVRAAYYTDETRLTAVDDFQKMTYERINKIVKFCKPKNVHFEKLLCSMIVLAQCMEGVLYDSVKSRMKEKQQEYARLPLDSTEQIYGAIAGNLNDSYEYSDSTKVFIFDCVRQETGMLSITKEQAEQINDTEHLCIGPMLYDFYKT
jgi:hypothetical protein